MIKSDLVIFSSPIYYGQVSAQLKTLIDRFYQVSQNPEKSLEGTKVIQIFTQANPTEAFDNYIESLKEMPFAYMSMEVIGTVIARGATGKGESSQLAAAIEEIEKIGNDL